MYKVIATGLDYVRYRVFTEHDIVYFQKVLAYLDITERRYHGSMFVDLSGKQIEVVRMFNDVSDVVVGFAKKYVVSRLDVFIDVAGNHLGIIDAKGTVIVNEGRIETIYSHNLKSRGNVPVFCRAYDAKSAGHYPDPVTRFECEFKRESARHILGKEGWKADPIDVALHNVLLHFGVRIQVEGHTAIDMDAPRTEYSHSRERFYTRYGQAIARDIEVMGVQGLYNFILECVAGRKVRDDSQV